MTRAGVGLRNLGTGGSVVFYIVINPSRSIWRQIETLCDWPAHVLPDTVSPHRRCDPTRITLCMSKLADRSGSAEAWRIFCRIRLAHHD